MRDLPLAFELCQTDGNKRLCSTRPGERPLGSASLRLAVQQPPEWPRTKLERGLCLFERENDTVETRVGIVRQYQSKHRNPDRQVVCSPPSELPFFARRKRQPYRESSDYRSFSGFSRNH